VAFKWYAVNLALPLIYIGGTPPRRLPRVAFNRRATITTSNATCSLGSNIILPCCDRFQANI
jgi:hypothetical protein